MATQPANPADAIRSRTFLGSLALGAGAFVVGTAAVLLGAPIIAGVAGVASVAAAAGMIGSNQLSDKSLTSIANGATSLLNRAASIAGLQSPTAPDVAPREPQREPSRAAQSPYPNSFAEDPKFKGGAIPMPTVTGDNFTPGPAITTGPRLADNVAFTPVQRPMPNLVPK